MIRGRVGDARDRVRSRLEAAFIEDHSPREVAFSFSLGVFITALPTLGFGVAVFLALAYLFKQLSKIALFASVIVLNPAVKWGVYGTSYWLGRRLLGPIPPEAVGTFTPIAGSHHLLRLWVGNLVLAVVFAVVAYVIALRLVHAFRRREADLESLPIDVGPK
ncbi:DUF2062 domain-containing protein [Halopenitus persicus]|uniref:DUF2062 domain-containing protein n=1 Tax=Halopenitus persicus TaxID=1048396 RepID=A0A1H3GC91_9EURY|nr:DUF2062 domain-containing protein [Halopenitus persicus]QHS16972.1 DUF2062 domain-containing protein [haloarchaeon 3A1-DGR]SDY00881.1 hypothetical protein SAMN05216564_102414 [Halopenitus persicus]